MAQLNEELERLIAQLKNHQIDKEEFERRWEELIKERERNVGVAPEIETVRRERIRSAERMARKL